MKGMRIGPLWSVLFNELSWLWFCCCLEGWGVYSCMCFSTNTLRGFVSLDSLRSGMILSGIIGWRGQHLRPGLVSGQYVVAGVTIKQNPFYPRIDW